MPPMMSQVIHERPIGRQFYAYIAQRTSVSASRVWVLRRPRPADKGVSKGQNAARAPAKRAVAFACA